MEAFSFEKKFKILLIIKKNKFTSLKPLASRNSWPFSKQPLAVHVFVLLRSCVQGILFTFRQR